MILCHYAECRAVCRGLFIVILNVIIPTVVILSVVMLSVFMLNVVMLSVVASYKRVMNFLQASCP
jgi:hypothetical protein